ncbi:MAG: hypothetical protein O7G85_13660 [Planctomycetota bacterium]|nr:hypothetical protein [Planctomycetota bacterium]
MNLNHRSARTIALLTLTLIVLTGQSLATSRDDPIRVLFIGNSYTYFNNLPAMLEAIAEADDDSPIIETRMIAPGGMTLVHHWKQGDALEAINEGDWDFVVLQSQSTFGERHMIDGKPRVMGFKTFHESARKFGKAIKAAGATPVFYQQWRRRESPLKDFQVISFAHHSIALELDAKVAPVGFAFELIRKEHPELSLYISDGSHPSPTGSLVAALVFYSTITGEGVMDIPSTLRGPAIDLRSGRAKSDAVVDLCKVDDQEARRILQSVREALSVPADSYVPRESPVDKK